jgi:hypothetical protein
MNPLVRAARNVWGPGWHLHAMGRCDRPELACVPLIVHKAVDD